MKFKTFAKSFLFLSSLLLAQNIFAFCGYFTTFDNKSDAPTVFIQINNVTTTASLTTSINQAYDPTAYVAAEKAYGVGDFPIVDGSVNLGWGGLWVGTKAGFFQVKNEDILEVHISHFTGDVLDDIETVKKCTCYLGSTVTLAVEEDGTLSCKVVD